MEIVKALNEGVVNVTFEKKDGTIREMVCTKNQEIITEIDPFVFDNVSNTNRKKDEVNITVYDVEVLGWRKINPNKIKSFN
jgi:hypothetical protein